MSTGFCLQDEGALPKGSVMAKGFAAIKLNSVFLIAFLLISATGCAKATSQDPTYLTPDPETYPIENAQFKNCHFKDPKPVYTLNSKINPNPILCDEGVATKVEMLSINTLPTGLQFSMDSLSLIGTATQKVAPTTYQFYIENEAGYLILNLNLTVK